MSSRTPLVPHHAEPGHRPPMGVPDGSGCHHLSARILCLHGPGRGSHMKVPNPSKQRPLAAWENGLASKHPCFISAFKIKTLCASANAGGNCHSSGKMKRAASALMLRSVGPGRGACLAGHALWPAQWPTPQLPVSRVGRFSEGTQGGQWTPAHRKEDPGPLTALVSLPSAPSVFLSFFLPSVHLSRNNSPAQMSRF